MRHQCKKNKLALPADQRKALLRSLATELFTYGEITTTLKRAKALQPYAENLITFAKAGDLASRREVVKFIYDKQIPNFINSETGEIVEAKTDDKNVRELTVLRKLFGVIAKDYTDRKGGYTRINKLPPRRGDNSEMALIQLV